MTLILALISAVALAFAYAAAPDIIVDSGGPCGIASAITAAREGAKVVHFVHACDDFGRSAVLQPAPHSPQ